jgi:hypothetical protein
LQHIFLVEGVIAKGYAIRARLKDQFGMLAAQAHAVRGILTIHHNEIERPLFSQTGKVGFDSGPACAAKDISEEQDFHVGRARAKPRVAQGRMPLNAGDQCEFAPICRANCNFTVIFTATDCVVVRVTNIML